MQPIKDTNISSPNRVLYRYLELKIQKHSMMHTAWQISYSICYTPKMKSHSLHKYQTTLRVQLKRNLKRRRVQKRGDHRAKLDLKQRRTHKVTNAVTKYQRRNRSVNLQRMIRKLHTVRMDNS